MTAYTGGKEWEGGGGRIFKKKKEREREREREKKNVEYELILQHLELILQPNMQTTAPLDKETCYCNPPQHNARLTRPGGEVGFQVRNRDQEAMLAGMCHLET